MSVNKNLLGSNKKNDNKWFYKNFVNKDFIRTIDIENLLAFIKRKAEIRDAF